MEFNDLISKFKNSKPNGNNSYMVKCPCHNDNTQSLSISEDNGKILMNCFAGCRTEDITRAIGIEMKDLFSGNATRPIVKSHRPQSVEYMYSDKLKKVRYYRLVNGEWKKSFYWNYKDDNGKWQKGKGDYKVPLYKQNLLSTVTDKDTVYIVEGEKDTDTLTDKLHFIAVSAPNGATKGDTKSKWNSNYNKLFKGLRVAIIPDNDDIGRAYAETIANQLLPIAKSVKVIDLQSEWDNLKDKGDITDIYERETPTRDKSIADIVRFKLSALTDLTEQYKPKLNIEPQQNSKPEERKYIKSNLAEFNYDDIKRHKADDIGTAKFFSTLVKDFMCYVPEEKAFYIYNGIIWEKDVVKENLKAGKVLMDFVASAQKLIPKKPDGEPKYWTPEETEQENINGSFRTQYKSLGNANGRERVMKDIKKLLYKSRVDFDTQPELLNCKNCTYNLETGEAQPHKASDYLTKCVNAEYDTNAYNERFEKFIDEICESDEERKTALQTALGYSLIGATPEECFFIAYGKSTRNGKGTLFDLVLDVVGDYGLQMDFDTIARSGTKDASRATPDLARLVGVRYVLVNEPQKGTCFNEGLTKQLTGSDNITARPLFGATIEFKPLFAIFITTNNLPAIADDTLFSSDRIRILPFEKHFAGTERDTSLKSTLRKGNGRTAVLNWLIEGYRLYSTNGLTGTKKGNEVLRQYRKDNDYIQEFIDECITLYPQEDIHSPKIKITEVQSEYNYWCRNSNIKPLCKRNFCEELEKHGVNIITHHKQKAIKAGIKNKYLTSID